MTRRCVPLTPEHRARVAAGLRRTHAARRAKKQTKLFNALVHDLKWHAPAGIAHTIALMLTEKYDIKEKD